MADEYNEGNDLENHDDCVKVEQWARLLIGRRRTCEGENDVDQKRENVERHHKQTSTDDFKRLHLPPLSLLAKD